MPRIFLMLYSEQLAVAPPLLRTSSWKTTPNHCRWRQYPSKEKKNPVPALCQRSFPFHPLRKNKQKITGLQQTDQHHSAAIGQEKYEHFCCCQARRLPLLFASLFLLQTGILASCVSFQSYAARFGKTICVFPRTLLRALVLTELQTTQN